MLLILLAAIGFLTAIFLTSLRVMKNFSMQTAEELAVTILDQTDQRIDRFFDEFEAVARTLATTKAVRTADEAGMRDLFVATVLARKRYLRAVYLGCVDGRMYEWGQGRDFVDHKPTLPPGYDPRARPWYRSAAKSDDFSISPPYLYASVDALGITGSLRVRDEEGGIAGVLGLDMLLEDLKRILEDLKIPKRGLPLLLTARGEIIAGQLGPEDGGGGRILRRFEAPDLARHLRRDEGSFSMDLEGETTLFVYRRNSRLGWFVLVGMPQATILRSVQWLLSVLTVVDLILMVMLTISLSIITNRVITSPLGEIVSVINRIEGGERGARIRITSRDEFALLGNEVNKLMDAAEDYSSSLEAKVRRRTEEIWRLQAENTRLRVAEERKRIYRDMHDSLGAKLTNIFFCNGVMRSVAERDPGKVRELVDGIETNCLDAIRNLKDIIWGMREEERRSGGFASYAAAAIGRRLGAAGMAFVHKMTPRDAVNSLDPEIKSELGMVFEELVSNVLKHSGAKKVSLRLRVEDGGIELRFADDGCGMEGGRDLSRCAGLSNIEYRVGRLGGEMRFGPRRGGGLEFGISIPSRLAAGEERA